MTNKQPEKSVDQMTEEIVKLAKTLVMADNIQESAIATMNFRNGVTQTLQAERQKREEMVSKIAVFAEHIPSCFLYDCEEEEYQMSKCDCGLYSALTQPPTSLTNDTK